MMKAIPYLFFAGTCSEALDFYREAIGAKTHAFVRYRDLPGASADTGDRVMHAEFSVGESTLFASDGNKSERHGGEYAIALHAADDVEAERLFAALGVGGRIDVPLMTTPFASRFGMLTDKYGTPWTVTTPQMTLG
jgi:PhnB protein